MPTNRKPQRPLTMNTLASAIAKREGKRSQARIGDIREVLSILADMFYAESVENEWPIDENADAIDVALYKAGKRRAKSKRGGRK